MVEVECLSHCMHDMLHVFGFGVVLLVQGVTVDGKHFGEQVVDVVVDERFENGLAFAEAGDVEVVTKLGKEVDRCSCAHVRLSHRHVETSRVPQRRSSQPSFNGCT